MSTLFPGTAIDSPTYPAAGNALNSPSHSQIEGAQNDAIVAIETKVGINSSAVTTTHDYKLSGVANGDKAMSLTGTEAATNKTFTAPTITTPLIQGLWDGWILGTGALLYVSATSFTIAGDYSAIIAKGDRLKLTNSTLKYFYVIATPTFAAGLTTVTVTGGDTYSLANAAITAMYYTKLISVPGHPNWLPFTTTLTGFSAVSNSKLYFQCIGNTCRMTTGQATIGGTSNAASFAFTSPVAALNTWPDGSSYTFEAAFVRTKDNGSVQSTPGQIYGGASSNSMSVEKNTAGGNTFTASGGKDCRFNGIEFLF